MEEYIKDPFNFIGSKFKLLPQILPLFPKDYKLFVDLFGGSGTVSVNQPCNKVIYNDKLTQLTELIKWFTSNGSNYCLNKIDNIISEYNLSKTNRQGYLDLRETFNEIVVNERVQSNEMLYCLITHAFNYQIGFNSKGEYNLPFGNERSSFNSKIRERLPLYVNQFKSKDLKICNMSFDKLVDKVVDKYENQSNKVFMYADSPYFSSDSAYSRTKYVAWTEKLEYLLYEKMDLLNEKGFKFALSNVVKNNGKENRILENWMSKYNIHYLDISYSNSNYQKDRTSTNKEVLITNY